MKSLLTPPQSVGTTLGVVGVVYAVHSNVLPPKAVMNATDAYDSNLEAARKQAAILSIGVVGGISLLAKDPNILIVGGLAAIALDWVSRYCIMRHPATGQIVTQTPQTPTLAAVS
jgi:hypothetical protein